MWSAQTEHSDVETSATLAKRGNSTYVAVGRENPLPIIFPIYDPVTEQLTGYLVPIICRSTAGLRAQDAPP